MGVCVSIEAAGVLAAGLAISVPAAEMRSEGKEARKEMKKREAAAKREQRTSRGQEEERIKNIGEKQIEMTGYHDNSDEEKETRRIKYNAKTDTASNFPNKLGFPISLHHGRRGSNALDFKQAMFEFSGSSKAPKKDATKSKEGGSRRSSAGSGDGEGQNNSQRRVIDLNKPEASGYSAPSYAPRGGPAGGPMPGYSAAVMNSKFSKDGERSNMISASSEGSTIEAMRRQSYAGQGEPPAAAGSSRARSLSLGDTLDELPDALGTKGREKSGGWALRLGGVGGKELANQLQFLNDPRMEGHVKRAAAMSAERKYSDREYSKR